MAWRLASHVAFRETSYGGLLIDIKANTRRWLNKTAANVVGLCDGSRSSREIVRTCMRLWETDEEQQVALDVSELLDQLQALGYIEETPDELPVINSRRGVPLESAHIHLSKRCNLRCIHCYNSSGPEMQDELTFEELTDFMDQLKAMGAFEVTISGGEPFYHPRIWDLLAYARRHFSVTVLTNGLLIDDEACERLRELGIKEIYVSLDGASPQTNDAIRGNGTFRRATAAVRRMVAHGLPVYLNVVVTRQNKHELDAMVELAKQLGVGRIAMQEAIDQGRAADSDVLLGPEEVAEFKKWLFKRRLTETEILVGELDEYAAPAALSQNGREYPDLCPAIRGSLALLPNGDTVPCTLMERPELVTGNIRKQSLFDIWNHSPLHQMLRALSKNDCEVCSQCKIRHLCGGGCRALAYFQNGRFTGPPASEECLWRRQLFAHAAEEAGTDIDGLVKLLGLEE